jgi:hypothetical protein
MRGEEDLEVISSLCHSVVAKMKQICGIFLVREWSRLADRQSLQEMLTYADVC